MATLEDQPVHDDEHADGPSPPDGTESGKARMPSRDRSVRGAGARKRLANRAHAWQLRAWTFSDKNAVVERASEKGSKWVMRRFRRMTLMWRGSRKLRVQFAATVLGTSLLMVAVGLSTTEFLFSWPGPIDRQAQCDAHAFGCGVVGGALVTVFVAGVAVSWVIVWRMFCVVDWGYARAARKQPTGFVPNAADVTDVVGRDDLCRVIEQDLRDRSSRRPHVIVGGVGAGKTAVLVRLTQWLADRGAVPVVVRLRDMKEDEDCRDLAARRFRSLNEARFRSDGEADRIWRRLCADGVVVVLADGLEEAMADSDARETSIRQVLDGARRAQLPLVITSRPDDALETLDVALIELGPLDEEKAFEYVRGSRHRPGQPAMEDRALRALMLAAKVAEMPLYLQLTCQLYRHDLFTDDDRKDLDSDHRLIIRLRLLDNWRRCIQDGRLVPDPAITADQRTRAIKCLSILAAAALLKDTLEVKFKSLEHKRSKVQGDEDSEPMFDFDPAKAGVASNIAARLGIVETLRVGVRFRHSIMQAYLGSLWIRDNVLENLVEDHDRSVAESQYLTAGLANGGREFLMALTMASASLAAESTNARWRDVLGDLSERLCEAAQPNGDDAPTDDWRVLLLASAYEIARMVDPDRAAALREQCLMAWPIGPGSRRVVAAKRLAVDRIAEVKAENAYEALYQLCLVEPNYRVRVASAQYIGSGGDSAVRALHDRFLRAAVERARELKGNDFRQFTDHDLRCACLQGWILPLMAGTAEQERDLVVALLDDWVEVCDGAPRALDACIAQGLKYEANRVPHPAQNPTPREHLVRHAETIINRTDYWYTRMSLLHALTLWMLPANSRSPADRAHRMARWAGKDPHPFVQAAADLCLTALATGKPAPYMWIDESGTVAKLGQRLTASAPTDWATLWLTESLGWVALNRRALRLVADAMLMLNLTDGPQTNEGTAPRFDRAARASRPDLPPCMTQPGQRACFGVAAGAGDQGWALPSEMCEGSCSFLLCPYPSTSQTLRQEFSESFCRRLIREKRAPWQEMHRSELRRFWGDMEKRARVGGP
jgi:hypothetical protein